MGSKTKYLDVIKDDIMEYEVYKDIWVKNDMWIIQINVSDNPWPYHLCTLKSNANRRKKELFFFTLSILKI